MIIWSNLLLLITIISVKYEQIWKMRPSLSKLFNASGGGGVQLTTTDPLPTQNKTSTEPLSIS